jgi:aminoglycoside phosphotransferase (APT) family kinase protein
VTSYVLTPEDASRALLVACRQAQLDPTDAELIRIGSNVVYRLRGQVIARIAKAASSAESAHKQAAVARWLKALGYPATRAKDVEQPVTAEGHIATFWESVSEREDYASISQVADLIRRLHELKAPDALALPQIRPFDKAHSAVALVAGLPTSDVDCLSALLMDLHSQYDELAFALPPGPIHGDANVGNVILDRRGEAVLIDLDNFCTGPREWDLVQTALFYERFGWHTAEEYRTFVEVYGFDIMSWPGYPVLADTREVMMTLWLGRKGVRVRALHRKPARESKPSGVVRADETGRPSNVLLFPIVGFVRLGRRSREPLDCYPVGRVARGTPCRHR